MTDRSRLDPEATVPLDGLLQALPGGLVLCFFFKFK